MLLSEQFEKDNIGKLLIETKNIKLKKTDKEAIVKILSGEDVIYEKINVQKIGEIISLTLSDECYELTDYIIETCDELGYKIIGSVTNEDINIKVIK